MCHCVIDRDDDDDDDGDDDDDDDDDENYDDNNTNVDNKANADDADNNGNKKKLQHVFIHITSKRIALYSYSVTGRKILHMNRTRNFLLSSITDKRIKLKSAGCSGFVANFKS